MIAKHVLMLLLVGLTACDATTYYFNLTTDDESDTRIVNGSEARKNAYPFMTRLTTLYFREDETFICGGSLISEEYVLTAAHCVYHPENGRIADEIEIILGVHNTQRQEAGQQKAKVIELTVNQYDKNTNYGDIALLKLNKPARITSQVNPICIPRAGAKFDGTDAKAVGWGMLGSNLTVSSVLRKVTLPVLHDSLCSRPYRARGMQYFGDVMLCAGYTNGSKDTCQGDSGGPLFRHTDKGFVIIGATSFGLGCASPGYPGIYTEISYYSNWIQNIVGSVCFG